jgi:hypothetical protein
MIVITLAPRIAFRQVRCRGYVVASALLAVFGASCHAPSDANSVEATEILVDGSLLESRLAATQVEGTAGPLGTIGSVLSSAPTIDDAFN